MCPVYRNWPAICAIVDPYFKLCVATTRNTELLGKLAVRFPEYFLREKPEHEGPWPLSVIRRVCATMHSDEPHMEQLAERLGIPVIRAMTPRGALEEWEKSYVVLSATEVQNLPSAGMGLPAFREEILPVFWLDGKKYYVFCFIEKDGYIDLIPAELINENH